MIRFVVLLAVFAVTLPSTEAARLKLAPYKDSLFAYPRVLARSEDNQYRVVDYQELRDINERDAIPERRVKRKYVSSRPRFSRREIVLQTSGGPLRHIAVGKRKRARIITLYLHGQGGNRRQGVNDNSFGGNFNRIQNLMVRAKGLYLSPDVGSFDAAGIGRISELVGHYAKQSPGAPIFVACGSMGGAICWGLAGHPKATSLISGYLLLGSFWDDGFLKSPAFARRVPLFFGHGSRDKVFPIDHQLAFMDRIRQRSPDYPALFVRFETGGHGTPIRMTDWRETLNWMLSRHR